MEAMRQEKVAEYANHLEELAEQNVVYRPLAFSAFGRVHPDATVLLTSVAQRAARRRGLGDHRSILRRAMAKVGVQIWRRAAAMVRACLPGYRGDDDAEPVLDEAVLARVGHPRAVTPGPLLER